jgi:hypothetical protein
MRVVTAVAIAVALAAVAGAIVDYRVTESRTPPIPPDCRRFTQQCEDERNQALEARQLRAEELEADYKRREWLFGVVLLGAALGWTAVALRRSRTPRERQLVFANLGVAGVVVIVAVSVLDWQTESHTIQSAAKPGYYPALAMLAAAAIGGLATRRQTGVPLERAEGPEPRWRLGVRQASLAGLGFTALTFVLAWIYASPQPSCGGSGTESAPDWTDGVLWAATFTSIVAAILGVFGLVARRWFVALVCFVVNPLLLIFMAASSCAFY